MERNLLKLNKCTMVFAVGMVIATASMAFFGDWMKQGMAMPQQMIQMTQPQPQVCDCKCN